MMKVKQISGHVDTFSGKSSELSRQLAFAGIAVIWVFKNSTASGIIPDDFLLPLLLLVLALAFDFLQYVLGSIEWSVFKIIQQIKHTPANEEDEVDSSPSWINYPHNACFILKILSVIFGYFVLIKVLAARL